MDINTAFQTLHDSLGSHSAAAKFIGMTPQHYTALRNGRANIPQRTADYILLKAKEAAEDMPLSPATPARPHESAQAARP